METEYKRFAADAFSEGKAAAESYLESEVEAEQSVRDTFAL